MSPYPDCQDLRPQVYRLISLQFVHEGAPHICFNILGLVAYGSIFEFWHGPLFTFAVFETAAVIGTLGQNFQYPFDYLIGCSGGVYGLIGANLANLLLNAKQIDTPLFISIGAGLTGQHLIDALLYVFAFNPHQAYSAHFYGWLVGLLLGCSFIMVTTGTRRKRAKSVLFFIAFIALALFFLFAYIKTWPPVAHYRLPLQRYSIPSCCQQVFQLMRETRCNQSEVNSQYICDGTSMTLRNPQ